MQEAPSDCVNSSPTVKTCLKAALPQSWHDSTLQCVLQVHVVTQRALSRDLADLAIAKCPRCELCGTIFLLVSMTDATTHDVNRGLIGSRFGSLDGDSWNLEF